MRDKTEAAKILLEKGWTLEEVLGVLGSFTPAQPIQIIPLYPSYTPHWHWWYIGPVTTGDSGGTTYTFRLIGDDTLPIGERL